MSEWVDITRIPKTTGTDEAGALDETVETVEAAETAEGDSSSDVDSPARVDVDIPADIDGPAEADDRPHLAALMAASPEDAPPPALPPRSLRARALGALRAPGLRGDGAILTALLALAGVTHGVGLYVSPQPLDGEGAVIAQVWASDHLADTAALIAPGGVPPLAWFQLSMWTELTGAFDRAPTAVAAGRELMVVVAVVATALVYWLARRVPLPRWGAAVAAACFALSPLAVEAHRTVSPENLATPWLLVALGLLLGHQRSWGAVVSSALCLAVAVLSSWMAVLLLPALVWVLRRTSPEPARRRATLVWTGVFVAAGLVPAVVLHLLPGPAGAWLDPTVAGLRTFGDVLALDPVLPVLALLVLPLALLQRRLRPFVVAVAVPVAVLLPIALVTRAPALTTALVVLLAPMVSLLVAGVARGVWRHRPSRLFGRDVRRVGAVGLLAAAAVVLAVAVPSWALSLRGIATDTAGRPLAEATAWVGANVPRSDRVLTDPAAWVELVGQGRTRSDVVGYRAASDPAELGDAWLVSTPSVRAAAASSDALADALARSTLVVAFGDGDPRVEVRRTAPAGSGTPAPSTPAPSTTPTPTSPTPTPETTSAPRESAAPTAPTQPAVPIEPSPWATAAVLQLLSNPAIEFGPQARLAMRSARVDDRLLSLLAALAARHELTVAELPRTDAEAREGELYRSALVTEVDGDPVEEGSVALGALRDFLEAQAGDFRSETSLVPASGSVPTGLLVDVPPRKDSP